MKLSEEQTKKVISFMQDFFKNPCNVCQKKEWIFNDTIFEIREFHGGSFLVGGKSIIYPVVIVTCKTCGNTLFFNAIQLGLIEKKMEGSQDE